MGQTRNRVTYPWPVEVNVKVHGGPNKRLLKRRGPVDSGEIPIEPGDSWFSSK